MQGNDARFCSKCGQQLKILPVITPGLWVRPENFESICETLIQLLDQVRNKWLDLIKEDIAKGLPNSSEVLINKDFHESHRVAMSEEEIPNGYAYNSITGETVEAALIYWQRKYSENFATREHDYLRNVDQGKFWGVFVHLILEKSGPRWLLSAAGELGSAATDDDCIIELLGHYIAGESRKSFKWAAVCNSVRKCLPFFRFMTHVSTAAAFGDEHTMQELMKQVNS